MSRAINDDQSEREREPEREREREIEVISGESELNIEAVPNKRQPVDSPRTTKLIGSESVVGAESLSSDAKR